MTKSTHLISVKATDRYCLGCDNYDTIVLNVFRKQIHLFGIPIFPTGKTGNAFCLKCKRVLEEESMPELIKHQYLIVKNKTKGPAWQIPGSIALLVISLTLSLAHKNTNQKELYYLASPNKGDIYEYRVDDSVYSTMKIIKVSTDSLYLYLNRLNVDSSSRLNRIEKGENYKKKTISFERQKINDMYNDGNILKIIRNTQFTE